jgi:hypothetical protein
VAAALFDGYLSEIVAERRSGAPLEWMRAKIAEADSFQLFWSSRSMTSATCRSEWEEALSAQRADFVRPLYWEEPFPHSEGLPPPGLAALRFVRLPVPKATVTGNLWATNEPAAADRDPDTRWPASSVEAPSPAFPAPATSTPTQPTSVPPPASRPEDRSVGYGPPPPAPRPAGAGAPALGALTGLVLTVAGLIGGTLPLGVGSGDGGHTTYWLLLVPGLVILLVSVAVIVARAVGRRR